MSASALLRQEPKRPHPNRESPSHEPISRRPYDTGCGLYVELKAPGSGLPCWCELARHGQRFAALGSFDPAQVRELREAGCDYPLSVLVRAGHDPHALGDVAQADVLHLCWEGAGTRPQDLVTEALLDLAFSAGREVVLWHEERPSVLADITRLPVLGICTDLPDLMRPTGPSASPASLMPAPAGSPRPS